MVRILAGADFFTDRAWPQRSTVLMIAELFRQSDLSPVYTPVLETGAAVLCTAIKARLGLDRGFHLLVKHLRGLDVEAQVADSASAPG